MTQIAMSGVAVEFGDTTILRDVTFTVTAGEKWGIVGRNGTGKTTLFNLVTGMLEPTRGAVIRSPGTRITLLEQHRDFGSATTVWQAVAGAFDHLLDLEQSLSDQSTRIGELGEAATPQMLDRYAHDLERFEREGGYEVTARVDAVLHMPEGVHPVGVSGHRRSSYRRHAEPGIRELGSDSIYIVSSRAEALPCLYSI